MLEFKNSFHTLVTSIIAISVFASLFVLRLYDDNTLVSWTWVFDHIPVFVVYSGLFAALFLANLLSRFPEPGPRTLFVVSFAISALFWHESELIIDASRYFTQAKNLSVYGFSHFFKEWGKGIEAWTDLPTVPFLYGLVFKVLGEARSHVQILTTTMFSATVVLTVLIGSELWDDKMGRTGGALLLGIPYLYTQVPLMLVDVPSMFFLMLSVYTFIKALDRGGPLLIGCSAVVILFCVFCKYTLWIMLSVLAVVLAVRVQKASRTILWRGLLIFLIAGMMSGGYVLYKWDVFYEQVRLLAEYQRPALKNWSESFASTFLFQTHPFLTLGALYSLYVAGKKKDAGYVVISWLLLLIILMQIRRIRYIIPVFPMLALTASYGICKISPDRLRRFIVSTAVVSSIILAVFVYLPFLQTTSVVNLRDAGRFLDSLEIEKVKVITLPIDSGVNPAVAVPMLDIFTDKDLIYEDIPFPQSSLVDFTKSPLRFTWHYRDPDYYAPATDDAEASGALVLISESPYQPLPALLKEYTRGYHKERIFDASSSIFHYRTIVTVYLGKTNS